MELDLDMLTLTKNAIFNLLYIFKKVYSMYKVF